jgi:hypothetical protein
MTIEELIKEGKDKVRKDKNLLSSYIELFKAKFGKVPDCAGCTFSRDWNKLTYTNYKIEIMSDKTFRLKNSNLVYTFKRKIEGSERSKPVRSFGYKMTEEFAKEYLTSGTDEEIAKRKLEFSVLPKEEKASETTLIIGTVKGDVHDSQVEENESDFSKLTKAKLIDLAIDKDYPIEEWEELKKDELIAYLEAKELK